MEKKLVPALVTILPFFAGTAFAFGYGRWHMIRTAPPLLAVPAQVDLGTVPEGNAASGTVSLVNPTDAPVRIKEIETSCGCTMTTKVAMVAPHGSVDLKVKVSTLDKRGSVKQVVSIHFEDEARLPLVIPIQTFAGSSAISSDPPAEPGKPCVAPKKG